MERAIEKGYVTFESLVDFAQLSVEADKREKARDAVRAALAREAREATVTFLARAIRLALRLDHSVSAIADSPSVATLSSDDQVELIALLEESAEEMSFVRVVAERALGPHGAIASREEFSFHLGIALIACGDLAAALPLFQSLEHSSAYQWPWRLMRAWPHIGSHNLWLSSTLKRS